MVTTDDEPERHAAPFAGRDGVIRLPLRSLFVRHARLWHRPVVGMATTVQHTPRSSTFGSREPLEQQLITNRTPAQPSAFGEPESGSDFPMGFEGFIG